MDRPRSPYEYSKEELHGLLDDVRVPYHHSAGITKLADLLKEHYKALGTTVPEPPPTTPVQPPAAVITDSAPPTTTMVDLRTAMDEVNAMKAELRQQLQAQPSPTAQPGENLSNTQLVKLMADAMRLNKVGETNEAGTMRAEHVDINDRLPTPARFWCRSNGFTLRELMIGPVPQAFPYGIDKVYFEYSMGPFMVQDSNFSIPQVWVISRFQTYIKSLAELLRQDVRYGTRFTEDSNILFGVPKLDEWQMSYSRHLAALNAQHDPMYPSARARELGVPYTSMSNPEGLRIAVARKLADNDMATINSALVNSQNERARELSLTVAVK